MPVQHVEPFYFGRPPTERFGVYHHPSAPPTGAVVLCYPLGLEYVRAHRAYRNLALSLCRAGMATLRFDYIGSGDSSGDVDEGGLTQWRQDVDAAIDEVKRRSGLTRVTLIGLRFGAALAALSATRRDDIQDALFWDPVLDGRAYLAGLRAVHAAWVHDRLGVNAEKVAGAGDDLIGLPTASERLAEIGALSVSALPPLRTRSAVIMVSTPRSDCEEWQRGLVRQGCAASYHHVPSAGDWLDPRSLHQLLLPHEILKEIVAVVTRR